MSDMPSESWTGKGAQDSILVTPTCPFCGEGLSVRSVVFDECAWCGKSGMEEEDLRQMRERAREAGGRLADRIWDMRMKAIFGTEGSQDDIER